MTFIYIESNGKEYFGYKIMNKRFVKVFIIDNNGIRNFGVYTIRFLKDYFGRVDTKRSLKTLLNSIQNERKYQVPSILSLDYRGEKWQL